MMNAHFLFCPIDFPVTCQAIYQEGDRLTKIEYREYWDGICWPDGVSFVIHYETTHEDGAVSNRTFEWKSHVLRPHHEVLKLKLRQTTRDDDRKVITVLLKKRIFNKC